MYQVVGSDLTPPAPLWSQARTYSRTWAHEEFSSPEHLVGVGTTVSDVGTIASVVLGMGSHRRYQMVPWEESVMARA